MVAHKLFFQSRLEKKRLIRYHIEIFFLNFSVSHDHTQSALIGVGVTFFDGLICGLMQEAYREFHSTVAKLNTQSGLNCLHLDYIHKPKVTCKDSGSGYY